MSAFFIPAIRPTSSAPTASVTASSARALDTREKYPAAVADHVPVMSRPTAVASVSAWARAPGLRSCGSRTA